MRAALGNALLTSCTIPDSETHYQDQSIQPCPWSLGGLRWSVYRRRPVGRQVAGGGEQRLAQGEVVGRRQAHGDRADGDVDLTAAAPVDADGALAGEGAGLAHGVLGHRTSLYRS